ncbi:MAG: diphthine--ammonia ligase [Candidatus Diapherotrites archaeon]|nr:diphthine--ammonia ligase [Candidatus Diapherotrites archaeon]
MKIGILFSGGKDSNFVMQHCLDKNFEIKCLISIIPKNPDSWMYQSVNLKWTKLQAKAIGLPIIQQPTKGEKEKELKEMKKAIALAKKKFKIEGIGVGAFESRYQSDRVQKICTELGLSVFSPLWQSNQTEALEKMISIGMEIIFTKIAALGLTEKWLGRKLDLQALKELQELNAKYGVNIVGEGGEFETFVCYAPFYKKRVKIISVEKIMENECTGKILIKKAKLI